MSKSNLVGALASSLAASCFVVGYLGYFTLLIQNGYPSILGDLNHQINFMMANKKFLQTWYAVMYLLFGFCLIVLVPVTYKQVSTSNALLAETGSVFGLVWAGLVIVSGLLMITGIDQISNVYQKSESQAKTLWLMHHAIAQALGGRNEIVGGLWILLINLAAYREQRFPNWICFTGLLVSCAGILTLVPILKLFTVVFELGAIIWFGAVAVSLLNNPVRIGPNMKK